jgi:endoglucanase
MEFSEVQAPGIYVIELAGVGQSYPFEIKESLLRPLAVAAMKAFYYQRASTPIEEKYAGKWSRPAGHPDTNVMVHSNAASPNHPAGTIISSPKGWYDAGDYNKYIVNSAYSIGLMLALAEDAPEYVKTLHTNIPESDNETPDLLDEIYYNLDWMFTMQDPEDGGVYHKLTTPGFEAFIKPTDCHQQRYVVYKSVTAALDFAASMAQAARVYAPYEQDYPGFPEKAIEAARKAYDWAVKHPDTFYQQEKLNGQYQPEVKTGTYGDGFAGDEFFWASIELFTTTGESSYLTTAMKYKPQQFSIPMWRSLAGLGYFTLLRNDSGFAKNARNEQTYEELKQQLLDYCNNAIAGADTTPFVAPYGNKARDFHWGCISESCANQAIVLLTAYRLTGERNYLANALRNADYILGRNATGYCYVTGFGSKSPMNPHHRLSASDTIVEPVPGLLVGGPNPHRQDGSKYPSSVPDEAYVDATPAYAANEIAINWNASLVYLSAMLGVMVN